MRKIILFIFNSIFILQYLFITGCNIHSKETDFTPKTNVEYTSNFLNTTIEMELIKSDKRSICFYSNDTNIFVFTIRHQYSSEIGYIYCKSDKTLYYYDDGQISISQTNIDFENNIFNIPLETNVLFHLDFKEENFEYKKTVTVCNRECDKYRFITNVRNKELIFNIYIDKETGFCLKAVCSLDDVTDIYFETKKFINQPDIDYYKQLLILFKKQNNTL